MKTLTILAVGIILGMLIAPDKGTNTRRQLSKALSDLKGENSTEGLQPSITSDDVINS